MPQVRSLAEPDLPEALRIMRRAFGTFFGVPDLDNFWADLDFVRSRHAAEHTASVAAEDDSGALAGSNFATRWGSVAFFGPLSIRPDLWDRGTAQPLVAAACRVFDEWGVSHAGLFTFPHSTKHVHLYGKFGFHPRFLNAVMTAPAAAGASLGGAVRYSALAPGDRIAAEGGARELCEALYPGLDLTGEIRTVAARDLGDTLLLWDKGGRRLDSFAVCHCGPATEAGDGTCFVKFGAVRPGPGDDARFAALLDACAGLAAAVGMPNVVAGMNLSHDAAYRQMKARGFRALIQGVKMHRGNEPGYDRPGLYIIDDWR